MKIKELRDKYLKEPTYYCWHEPCGLAEVGELAAKRVHRNWWDEYYPDIDYGGMDAKTYYDEIADYAIQVCADQLGVKSEHDRLLEEDDTWYPYTNGSLPPGSEVTFEGVVVFSDVHAVQGETVSLSAMADSCAGDESMPAHCRIEEGDEGNNESASLSVSLPSCIDFEDLVLETAYKVTETFTTSGKTVTVRSFIGRDGDPSSDGFAIVGNGEQAGGRGQEMWVAGVNLDFDFDTSLAGLSLLYGEYGGYLNLSINGDFRRFGDFAVIDGLTVGGVDATVSNGSGRDTGSLRFIGTINSFFIGGEELYIDDVCYW